jgi:hypothetical protein
MAAKKKKAAKKAPAKKLKACQRRIKGGRVVLKAGYKYGKGGKCIKVGKKPAKKAAKKKK